MPVGAMVKIAQFLIPYSLILALIPFVRVLQKPDSKNLSASNAGNEPFSAAKYVEAS